MEYPRARPPPGCDGTVFTSTALGSTLPHFTTEETEAKRGFLAVPRNKQPSSRAQPDQLAFSDTRLSSASLGWSGGLGGSGE